MGGRVLGPAKGPSFVVRALCPPPDASAISRPSVDLLGAVVCSFRGPALSSTRTSNGSDR